MTPEVLALVHIRNPEPVVDSQSLTYYLLGAGFLWTNQQKFARHLNLGAYTEGIQEFYRNTKTVDIFSEAQKAELLGMDFGDTSQNTVWSRARRELQARVHSVAHIQGLAEGSRTFYYDFADHKIKATDIVHGSHTSTPSSIFTLLKQDGEVMPLIETHTHTDDSFISAQDYHPILTRFSASEPTPLANAILVVCPNIQILSLATWSTPMMAQEEAIALMTNCDNNLMVGHEERSGTLRTRYEKVMGTQVAFATHLLREFSAKVLATEAEMLQKGYPEHEIKVAIEAMQSSYKDKINSFSDKFKRVAGKAQSNLFGFLARITEGRLLEFARSINVIHYCSTNSRDFYRFSA